MAKTEEKNSEQNLPTQNNQATPSTEQKNFLSSIPKMYWMITTAVLLILLILSLAFGGLSGLTGNVVKISENEAGQKVVDFANAQGANAELVSVNDDGQFYEVIISMQGQELPVYVTKDGENLAQLVPLETPETPEQTNPQQSQTIPKSDEPTAELFVMTHCPYGTQAEKGFIPFLESFDKANTKIRFVHYFMHEPEEEETPRQVCIREEQPTKFITYLKYFLEEGDAEYALEKANINTQELEECISSGRADEYYAEDSALSEAYGVQGSPTLVVNGQIVSSGRSPDAYLQTTCEAFNEQPEECSTLTLETTSPNPMWGWDGEGSNTQAQC